MILMSNWNVQMSNVSSFGEGDKVIYYPKKADPEFATILRTHLDDDLPYFTVLLEKSGVSYKES